MPQSMPQVFADAGHPSASAHGEESERKGVSTIELFFDLVFVFAVTRTSELLQEQHSWMGVAMAFVAFVPVFWLWVGTTMFANLTEVDNLRGRAVFFAVALSGMAMALALPESYGHAGPLFAAAYWWGRIVLLLAVRHHRHRREFITFPVGAFITAPLLMLGAFLPETPRLGMWALAGLIDLGTPLVLRRRVTGTPFNVDHLADRYGTFVIIALGETIVATGTAAAHGERLGLEVCGAALGLAVGWGLWWTYFGLAAPVIARGLSTSRVAIDVIRPVLSYGHVLLVSGIIAIAAGIGVAVGTPLEPLPRFSAALLLGGTALFLATFGFTRWRLTRTVAVPRLVGAACSVALLAITAHVDAVVVLVLLTVVLLLVNLADHLQTRRTLRLAKGVRAHVSPPADTP